MKRFALLLLLTLAVWAQDTGPRAGFVYPAGVKQGSSIEVVVGGQRLAGVKTALVTGGGVDALVVRYDRPLNGTEATKLRDELRDLNQKKPPSAEEKQRISEIRAQLDASQKKNQNPAIAERVTVALTVAPDATPGERELRLSTPNGITNPLVFQVGRLPEVVKTAPQAGPVDVQLPAVINGQIAQGGTDAYRFDAHAGQQLIVAVSARKLIPYISDAVPGWFQAAITVRDSNGVEVAFADHYRFDPDPVLHYEVPAEGRYTLEIRDSIYRGREDFIYRIIVGDLPYLTDIFPLGGRIGTKTKVELAGWNLPARQTTVTSSTRNIALPFAFDTLPEALEKEPNDIVKTAQQVKLPVIVNGRIGRAGDVDLFRFKGSKGDEIVAEITARRLGSPLDSMLRLVDAKGREIVANDDAEDRGAGLQTHHADSRIQVKLPAGGTYYLQVSDAQRKGGSEYAYRLRISKPMPGFRTTRDTFEHRRAGRSGHAAGGVCAASRRVRWRYRAIARGRAGGLLARRCSDSSGTGSCERHAGRAGQGVRHAAASVDRGSGKYWRSRSAARGDAGRGSDAGLRVPSSGTVAGHAGASHRTATAYRAVESRGARCDYR